MVYKAHINEVSGEIQTVKEHSENTANLCKGFSISAFQDIMYVMGILHDIGKYQVLFQQRINGQNIKIEHSGCGAKVARQKYPSIVGDLMAYCIAGHHSGIPDGGFENDTPDQSTLSGRMNREFEDFDYYKNELNIPEIDEKAICEFIARDCSNDMKCVIDKFAFLTRYCFSCLTDADSLDTAMFCDRDANRSMYADFENCLKKVNREVESFHAVTELQKTRAVIQEQVFSQSDQDAEIYLINMPTGSGKTLCSIKFALQRALKGNKKRIIYIIPYNSIIEQTADTFEHIFGAEAEILRHHSTFFYDEREDYSEDYRDTIRYATENWDAQMIITTAVQFFESIHANKRSKLRKLHNMADSILIFDEVHLMPTKYLQPCLEAVSYITKILNSEAVFLTATMPDYENLIHKYALSSSVVCELIRDKSMYYKFNKCNYEFTGELSNESLITRAGLYPSSLIIVNRKADARDLYSICGGNKFHLSTYMTSFDRSRVINKIKRELDELENDYPGLVNVPDERKITVVSTSLIEAGVDLDFFTVFRELSGLDSILQAGGRCNREGKRRMADVFIFTLESRKHSLLRDERLNITRGILDEYKDISCQESINAYYNRVFFVKQEDIVKNSISKKCNSVYNIPFRQYAEDFQMIDSDSFSIVVSRDEVCREMVERLKITKKGSIRKFQKYSLSVHQNEFEDLFRQHVINDFDSGIFCLTNMDYYDADTGIQFEGKDYIL